MRQEDTDLDFQLLKRRIFKDTSLDCKQYKDNYLKRRISVRMRNCKVKTYQEYLTHLIKNPEEYDDFLEDITINVTHFLRDPQVFNLIREEILPMIIYDKVSRKRKVIRLWSAGCSSGEEAYSLAMILHDLLDEEYDNFIASVHGSDIDPGSLNRARKGIYHPKQMDNIPPDLLETYFEEVDGMFEVTDLLKGLTRFRSEDLFADNKGAHYDLILCRNVVIYFTKEQQAELFMKFYNKLNNNGYLIIGKTEMLFGKSRDLFHIINGRERIYQKRVEQL